MVSSVNKLVLGANVTQFIAAMKRAQVAALTSRRALIGLGAAAAGFAAVQGLQFINSVIQMNDELAKAAGRAGIAASRFADLAAAARLGGADARAVETAYRGLNRSLDEARQGIAEYADVYKQANINIQALIRLPIEDRLQSVARSLLEVADAGERSAIAQQILGRAGTQLLPALETIAGETDDLTGLTDEQAAAAEEAADSIEELTTAFNDLKTAIVTETGLLDALRIIAEAGTFTLNIVRGDTSTEPEERVTQQQYDESRAFLAVHTDPRDFRRREHLAIVSAFNAQEILDRAGARDRASLVRRGITEAYDTAAESGILGLDSLAEVEARYAGGETELGIRGLSFTSTTTGGGGGGTDNTAEVAAARRLRAERRYEDSIARVTAIQTGQTRSQQQLLSAFRDYNRAVQDGDEAAKREAEGRLAVAKALVVSEESERKLNEANAELEQQRRESVRINAEENRLRAQEIAQQFGVRDRLTSRYRDLLFRSGNFQAANQLGRSQGLGLSARTSEEAGFIFSALSDITGAFGIGSQDPLRDRLIEEVGEIVKLMREQNMKTDEVVEELRNENIQIRVEVGGRVVSVPVLLRAIAEGVNTGQLEDIRVTREVI